MAPLNRNERYTSRDWVNFPADWGPEFELFEGNFRQSLDDIDENFGSGITEGETNGTVDNIVHGSGSSQAPIEEIGHHLSFQKPPVGDSISQYLPTFSRRHSNLPITSFTQDRTLGTVPVYNQLPGLGNHLLAPRETVSQDSQNGFETGEIITSQIFSNHLNSTQAQQIEILERKGNETNVFEPLNNFPRIHLLEEAVDPSPSFLSPAIRGADLNDPPLSNKFQLHQSTSSPPGAGKSRSPEKETFSYNQPKKTRRTFKSIEKGNNNYGRKGKPRCAQCRKRRIGCIYNDIWEPCQYCLSKRFTVACIKIFGDGKQSTTISDPPRSLPLADDAQISPSDKLLYHHAFSDQILLSKPNFLPLTLIRKFAAGNGGVITSPSLRQAILALSAFAIKADGGFDDKVTEYVGKASMELRRKTEGTIDDMDLGAIYILTHIQRDERPVHAVGLLTVLSLLNSSLSQGSRTQDCLRRFRTVSFDYAATIPTSHTARTNIRQALYRNVYFRFPTLEDRISCYVEFNAPRNYNGIEAAVCISLSHQFSRLLDLLYLSTQTGEVTFEQESLLRDTEEELRGREYKRVEGVARTATEVPESIFQVPNMGLLGLNSILYLGIQLLIKVLDPLTEMDEHILGAARTLVEVLWKARITVYINPRRGPWMSALLLLTTLVLPKGDLEQYDFYFLRNRMDEFAMYDAIQEYWETEDKMAALETLQFFATNWRPFW